jgi:hypothetical protein
MVEVYVKMKKLTTEMTLHFTKLPNMAVVPTCFVDEQVIDIPA